ncbi:MAG TPA: SGNH/GDSL hydrolase family protein [Woeseiaceae bacterium]|nr:SGNH/GDSL hydrolase family protein [Woeseiaceae bacterium]
MLHYFRTMALGPILLAQGAWARLNVPQLPEPPGERLGSAGRGPTLKLLVTGDSAAAGVGAGHQDEALLGQIVARLRDRYRVSWNLQARSGDTTADTLERLDQLEAQHFDVAVTSLGVNDVIRMTTRDDWRSRQAALWELLRKKFGVSTLIVSGLPPVHDFPALPQPLRWHIGSRATEFNADLAAAAEADGRVHFVDLRFEADISLAASDGFHPGPGVYALWGERVADIVLAT